MKNSVNDEYFDYLLRLIGVDQIDTDYLYLLRDLHKREFVWTIEGDDNRESDGLSLRDEFNDIYGEVIEGPCSVLEMLIGLAARIRIDIMPDIEECSVEDWFWMMIDNLALSTMRDSDYNPDRINDILDCFLDRSYDYDGKGGLFPLKRCNKDQKNVEIWYQMQSFLLENYGF